MKVTHNIQSLNAIRLVNVNIESYAESTGKISSGYKINCAADNPAGLGISEIMRRQIRGLMQATNNTKDGVAFVQTADGAMDEIHSMLQRMNELSDKALNGTWSDSDRMAMNVEFDQLRTEIDRINNTTDFGTGIPVFEQHEPSYYQISGNIKWDDNQLHTISSMSNELNIHLPDGYEPKDYTITVPAGVYTTQELIDEIDDALSSMVPPNPGFVFELTSDGYCNLNFEKADGTPTKIDFVDGSLSYLIYEFQGGSASASILGTTIFGLNETLEIKENYNDTIIFYTESAEKSTCIKLKIEPAGYYTRSEMIDKLNELLANESDAAGIVAKEYGDSCIQITGGDKISILGLKGNMFKYEDVTPVYTSVFYDNVRYGEVDKNPSYIIGNYHASSIPISINASNNKLCFKLNGSNNYTTITLTNGYYNGISALADEINKQLKAQGLDQNVVASNSNQYPNCLDFRCTLTGTQSKIEFDTTTDPVYKATYETLFLSTSQRPTIESGQKAYVRGYADLSNTISLEADASLSFKVNVNGTVKEYTINNIGAGPHTLDSLINKLNNEIQTQPKFSDIKDKIEFAKPNNGSNRLYINATKNDVSSIRISNQNQTYLDLFTISTTTVNEGYYTPILGSISRPQGSTTPTIIPASTSVTVPKNMRSTPINIDASNNQLNLYFSNTVGTSHNETITLTKKQYNNFSELYTEIVSRLRESTNEDIRKTTVSYDSSGRLTFTYKPTNSQPSADWNITFPDYPNGLWRAILGTQKTTQPPEYQVGQQAELYTNVYVPESITLDSSNNVLVLNSGGNSVTITLDQQTYTREQLQTALQTKINNSGLTPAVTVNISSYGRITLSTVSGTFASFNPSNTANTASASGSFYENVMIRQYMQNPRYRTDGKYGFKEAFTIGSQDLTVGPIEIKAGYNDVFTFDFTYIPDSKSSSSGFEKTITVTIPENTYNSGNELAASIQKAIKDKYGKELEDFEIKVTIGGNKADVQNTDPSKALNITVKNATGKEPDTGEYIVDGIRGNSAYFIFYKTNGKPKETYILGTKNIWEGVSFEPGKNVLTLSANSVPYKYTFEKPYYTAQEFLDTLNSKFENGDDNGNSAPLEASIENGVLKLSHKSIGANTITDIGGSGRNAIFFEEEGRDSLDPLVIQVGSEANQTTEIPRISVSSTALGINSITISKQKYAEKANVRIKEAINQLSSKRSTYGAIQNRLEHTINNNDIVVDRMQASESRIRDTDLSSEMIRYSSLSILLQAGQKMLAQSNENIKKLLNLLQ